MADSFVAAVSVLGTLAGGGLTAAVAFRSERRKDAALADQQRLQLQSAEQQQMRLLRAEERRQVRELQIDHRRQVYQQFLADAHTVNHDGEQLGATIVSAQDEQGGDIDAMTSELDAAVRAAGGSLRSVPRRSAGAASVKGTEPRRHDGVRDEPCRPAPCRDTGLRGRPLTHQTGLLDEPLF